MPDFQAIEGYRKRSPLWAVLVDGTSLLKNVSRKTRHIEWYLDPSD